MMIPVRCFSCGKPIGEYWEDYKKRIAKGEAPKKILDDLGVDRYCCRAAMLGTVDLIDTVGLFNNK